VAIQNALDETGVVILVRGDYHVSSLTLHSGNTISALGATVHCSEYNAIVTDTFAPDAVASDVQSHAGSATLDAVDTSSITVGDVVSVMGAGHGGTALYGTVTAKTATTFTTSVNAFTSVGGLTANLYRRRIHDVTIHGGRWIQEKGLVWAHDANVSVSNGLAFVFRRVDGLTITDATFTTSTKLGQIGGRYTLSVGDSTMLTIRGINLDTTAGDGIHVHGPARDVDIRNVHGYNVGDDLVAFGTLDGSSPLINDTSGNIEHVVVDGVYGVASWSSVKFFDRLEWAFIDEPTTLYHADDIVIQNIFGTYKAQNISLEANLHANNVTIRGDHGIPPAGNPSVNVTSNHIANLTIEDSIWRKQGGSAPYLAVQSPQSVTVRNIIIGGINSTINDMIKVTGFSSEYTSDARAYITIVGVHGMKQNFSIINITALRNMFVSISNIGDVIYDGHLLVCRPDVNDPSNSGRIRLNARDVTFTPSGQANSLGMIFSNASLIGSAISDSTVSSNMSLIAVNDDAMVADNSHNYDLELRNVIDEKNSLQHYTMFTILNGHGSATAARFHITSVTTKIDVKNLLPVSSGLAFNLNQTLAFGIGPVFGDGSKWISLKDPTKTYTPDYNY
jgi:hypothetical protein